MRNTPGNIIQFPESTLMSGIQQVIVNLSSEDTFLYIGNLEVALEAGYVYHLTNGAIVFSLPGPSSGLVHGSVHFEIYGGSGTSYDRIALLGDDLMIPPYAERYVKSQNLDLWLWGNVIFGAELTIGVEGLSGCEYQIFLVKYRR
jgi:hypothetical protein